jgi:hypothetical protein
MTPRGSIMASIIAIVLAAVILVSGVVAGRDAGQTALKKHACRAACTHVGSTMESQSGNLCTCKNLRTMRGDYSQLFLKGTTNE